MSKSAYIKLVPASKQKELTLDTVKQLLFYYQKMTEYTGKQLDWDYQNASFPYELIEREDNGRSYLLLQGKNHLYHYLMLGVSQDAAKMPQVQLVLPDQATHGDQAKANELSRFLAKQLEGELHMFNGRIMYFYKRK